MFFTIKLCTVCVTASYLSVNGLDILVVSLNIELTLGNKVFIMSERILIVEDDERLASLISEYLQQHNFDVICHERGDTAEEAIMAEMPDLLILDVMLPGKSGFDVCRDICPHFLGPILMMTASEDNVDEIIGLELGADDYLTKPVEPRLLLARVRALLRRKQVENDPNRTLNSAVNSSLTASSKVQLYFGVLSIDANRRSVTLAGEMLDFTTAEFDLLWLLATNAGKILSRDDILGFLRGISFYGLDRSIDARVSRLRKKLQENPDHPTWLKTVRGKGYFFTQE